MSHFSQKVLEVVSKIPKGKTLTYKEVAIQAGSPKAFRAVGNILNKNYDPKIPCHRVIRSDGTTGGYNRGPKKRKCFLKTKSYHRKFTL
ncbi:MAG: MGMT family protein [Candidatus Gracilibacteria bacterium]|nr:MGMT family protein [Candidatus Gracilibacteria bacterium]